MSLYYLNVVYYLVDTFFLLQFVNEWPSRVALLLRLPLVAGMSLRERQVVDLYIDDIRDLFAKCWSTVLFVNFYTYCFY